MYRKAEVLVVAGGGGGAGTNGRGGDGGGIDMAGENGQGRNPGRGGTRFNVGELPLEGSFQMDQGDNSTETLAMVVVLEVFFQNVRLVLIMLNKDILHVKMWVYNKAGHMMVELLEEQQQFREDISQV